MIGTRGKALVALLLTSSMLLWGCGNQDPQRNPGDTGSGGGGSGGGGTGGTSGGTR
ncbi:MAG: hypothetical protein WCC10_16825 [Tumebacillaceae bacterium]